MVLHRRRLVLFGGVHDEDTADGDGLVSQFYNDLHAYSLEAGRWHELTVSGKGRAGQQPLAQRGGGGGGGGGGGSDDEGAGSSELLIDSGGRRRNRHKTGGEIGQAGKEDGGAASAVEASASELASGSASATDRRDPSTADQTSEPQPCPRMNANAALRGNTLYIFGGLYEPEEQASLHDQYLSRPSVCTVCHTPTFCTNSQPGARPLPPNEKCRKKNEAKANGNPTFIYEAVDLTPL